MAQPRLNGELLNGLAKTASGQSLTLPTYDVAHHKTGIVHLGLGAFARAHLADYTDSVLAQQGGDWRIVGVSLRRADVAEQLVPQNGLYTLVEQHGANSGKSQSHRVVAAISGVLVAPNDPAAVLEAMQDSAVHIVSLTVTEKGYCHDSASGALQLEHPDIQWDLEHLEAPRTAIGFIVAGLAGRFARGQPAFTPLSLDNLPNNGALLKRLTVAFAQLVDTALAARIEEVEFPSTMVDRIVPATTDADRAELASTLGYTDRAMVKTEPFTQWVIEDRFPAGRPAWNLGGALFVDEVEPFETMKLRLLNGSHSAIAYLGALAGHDFVHEVMGDPELGRFVAELMAEELAPTLVAPRGISLGAYQNELIQRFTNSSLEHRTLQIATDGSQKLPQRILAPLRHCIASGAPYERLALVIAAWFAFVERTLVAGGVAALSDPLASELNAVVTLHADDLAARVNGYLRLDAIFGMDLVHDKLLAKRLCHWLRELEKGGGRVSVR